MIDTDVALASLYIKASNLAEEVLNMRVALATQDDVVCCGGGCDEHVEPPRKYGQDIG